MNNSPPPLEPQSSSHHLERQSKKSTGCLFGGMGCGLGCLLILAIFITLSIFTVVQIRNFIDRSAVVTPLEAPAVSNNEIQESVNKFHRFAQAVRSDDLKEPISFTEKELNAIFWNDPAFEKMAGKVQVEIDRDILAGKFSVTAEDLPIPPEEFPPFLKGRSLSGKISLTIPGENHQPVAQLKSVELNGFTVPAIFLSRYQSLNLFDLAKENPAGKKFIDQLESLRVEDNKLWIVPKPKS